MRSVCQKNSFTFFQIRPPAHTVDPPVRGKCSTVHRVPLDALICAALLLFVLTHVGCMHANAEMWAVVFFIQCGDATIVPELSSLIIWMWGWVHPRVRNTAGTRLKQKSHANSCWHWAWPLTFKIIILAYFSIYIHHILDPKSPAIRGKRGLAHKQAALEELKKKKQQTNKEANQGAINTSNSQK